MDDLADFTVDKLYPDEYKIMSALIRSSIENGDVAERVLDTVMQCRDYVMMGDDDTPFRLFYQMKDRAKRVVELNVQLNNAISKIDKLLLEKENYLLFGRHVASEFEETTPEGAATLSDLLTTLRESSEKVKADSQVNFLPKKRSTPKSIFVLLVGEAVGDTLNRADKGRLLEEIFKAFNVTNKLSDNIAQALRNREVADS
jgi:hypothetical protein